MTRRSAGFTLVEVMITLVILGIAMAAVGSVFNNLVGHYKAQSKVSQTGMEGMIGLEILRKDLEQAGYGLPWNMGLLTGGYPEATGDPNGLNDSPDPPRAIASADAAGAGGSDYLAIKSASVSGEAVSRKWTILQAGDVKRAWAPAAENPIATDRVIVLRPGFDITTFRTLVCPNASTFSTEFNDTTAFTPALPEETHIVYGLDAGAPARPFNRADYSIDTTPASVPQRCAPGTGVLVKAVLGAGGAFTLLPLLDCVADFQVAYLVDTDGNGVIDNAAVTSGADALQVRNLVREIRVYVLAHDGQRDRGYTHSPLAIPVGESYTIPQTGNVAVLGRSFDVSSLEPDPSNPVMPNYRWKVYSLAIQPSSLR